MANVYNIPSAAVEDVVEQLTELYSSAYMGGVLQTAPSAMLWGAMGVGKSTAVAEIADRLSERIQTKAAVTEIRLLNFSPVDLRGIPAADTQRQFTVWLKPKIFDMDRDMVHILFLDEISAAPQALQASAYQIALDKRIGEFPLPENCIVICAGNRTTDRSVAFRMPKALANRLMHFEVQADFESWYRWAARKEIDPRVIGYLAFDNSRLAAEAGVEELAFPTPRTWEYVSRLLKTSGKEPAELHLLLSGCIGVSNAAEFESWCSIYRKLPSVEDILSGRCTAQIREMDVLYALVSSLLACVSQRKESLKTRELENICNYASYFPADFAALLFRGFLQIQGMDRKLAAVSSFLSWMKKNKRYL